MGDGPGVRRASAPDRPGQPPRPPSVSMSSSRSSSESIGPTRSSNSSIIVRPSATKRSVGPRDQLGTDCPHRVRPRSRRQSPRPVLDRDQAVDAAELVDHERHVNARLSHLKQQVEHAHRRGHEQHPAQQGFELEALGFARARQHVLDVNEADHVVQGAAIHRQARMPGLAHGLQQLLQAGAHLDAPGCRHAAPSRHKRSGAAA